MRQSTRMTLEEFFELARRSGDPVAQGAADTLGKIFELEDGEAYIVEVDTEKADAEFMSYLNSVFRSFGVLGAVVPKGIIDIPITVVPDE